MKFPKYLSAFSEIVGQRSPGSRQHVVFVALLSDVLLMTLPRLPFNDHDDGQHTASFAAMVQGRRKAPTVAVCFRAGGTSR